MNWETERRDDVVVRTGADVQIDGDWDIYHGATKLNGTITTSPKNPYTIDGIPAIRLIPDLQMP